MSTPVWTWPRCGGILAAFAAPPTRMAESNRTSRPRARPATRRGAVDPLAQVRELLFGTQIAEQKQQRTKLVKQVRAKVDRKSTELTARTRQLAKRFTDTTRRLDRSIAALESSATKLRTELRREAASATKQLQAELLAMRQQLEGQVAAAVTQLAQGKADRSTLAALFKDLARQIGSEPSA